MWAPYQGEKLMKIRRTEMIRQVCRFLKMLMNVLLSRPTASNMHCAVTTMAPTHVCATLATLGKGIPAMVRFFWLNPAIPHQNLKEQSQSAVKFKLGVKRNQHLKFKSSLPE